MATIVFSWTWFPYQYQFYFPDPNHLTQSKNISTVVSFHLLVNFLLSLYPRQAPSIKTTSIYMNLDRVLIIARIVLTQTHHQKHQVHFVLCPPQSCLLKWFCFQHTSRTNYRPGKNMARVLTGTLQCLIIITTLYPEIMGLIFLC